MDNEANRDKPEKKHIGSDLIIPVAALIFTLYYFSTIIHSPWTAQVSAFFIGSVLIALIVAFLVMNGMSILRGKADLGLSRLTEPMSFMPTRMALLALTIAYIYVIHIAGFTITTFVFLSAAMMILSGGRRWLFILILSAILAVGAYFLFEYTFEVRFPKGPFEYMMAGVL